jgi:hypothetical protein
MASMLKKSYLWVEMLAAFGGLPLLVYFFRERWLIIAMLWIGSIVALAVLKHQDAAFGYRADWNLQGAKQGLNAMLRRFALMSLLLFAFTVAHDFDRLFSFPLERPQVWIMVMLLYPILSAWPQEILYRTFFMRRYAPLFGAQAALMSAAAFSYVHIIFENWIAIVFTFFGGWLFADTYRRHRSLALVTLEHALYGCLIFTLGLGWYFYGAAWKR